jgi:type IV pilus assembly protein PilA
MTGTKRLLALMCSSILALTTLAALAATEEQPVPQTARQAVLEMFFSKTPGTFEKHLPQATRSALQKASATSGAPMFSGFSALTGQLSAHGQQIQTFEAGTTLVLIEDQQTHSKFEITVERDDLRGDEDEIELGFHSSKEGQSQTAGAKFRLNLTMKQEGGAWQLNEVSVAVGVSLTDPDFLKAMTKKMTPAAMSTTSIPNSASTPSALTAMGGVNENAAVAGVRTINTAEVSYATSFPAVGFTCTLPDLGGMGSGGGPTEHQAMLLDPRLASGRKNGYVFALSGCGRTPVSKYSVTAAPADPGSGTRAFCSDESGVIRFSADGKASSCLAAGRPLH